MKKKNEKNTTKRSMGDKFKIAILKALKKLFKRKHPYAPVNYLGRKRTQRILGAKIKKRKQIENDDSAD
ncbi:hypothetical protein [Aliiglaciecola lipolytica]|uniref:Uncharacterized protein n=1 Tax=Aliiglaciecola lipolytica E3 TaxID=1127673 RepID=K6Y721_9ALTE|nr:hypothetical protein [Aliiglaciecola lipolytica]GAC14017.1 hypothetical protein GLIP_1376 [Aliiglaciecola lipolytica E3]